MVASEGAEGWVWWGFWGKKDNHLGNDVHQNPSQLCAQRNRITKCSGQFHQRKKVVVKHGNNHIVQGTDAKSNIANL